MTGPLYTFQGEEGGILRVARDFTDPRGLILSVAQQPVAVAVALPREQLQHFIQALDDFLYESRP